MSQERLMDEGMEDMAGGAGHRDPAAVVHDPGFLATAWSFISTFFTSIVPEGRHQPAN